MQALRYNVGKPRLSMIDLEALEPMVRVLEYGADKYARNNWKKGLPPTEIADSLLRHLTAYLNGEDLDPESGQPHVGHVACNAMFLCHGFLKHPGKDDREVVDASTPAAPDPDEVGVVMEPTAPVSGPRVVDLDDVFGAPEPIEMELEGALASNATLQAVNVGLQREIAEVRGRLLEVIRDYRRVAQRLDDYGFVEDDLPGVHAHDESF